ncbi:hypothetical protein [Mesorhizobium sp. RMAD-H1]|uniref:hypothetical protein n=1 Tax=Mesorhizobium sp. RMAD-H1 TaxID=2587065 RepID=UPI0016151A87|nr:hypothetical protein [Mesorhizobium sp. RMAD-H1]MBB2973003.1 hypothetical protein [Mesorhizobium sp. RMAD-H1]
MAMAQTTLHASSPRSLLSRLGGYLTRRRPKRLDPRMLSEHLQRDIGFLDGRRARDCARDGIAGDLTMEQILKGG